MSRRWEIVLPMPDLAEAFATAEEFEELGYEVHIRKAAPADQPKGETMTTAFQLAPARLSIEDLRIEALRFALASGTLSVAEAVQTASTYLAFLTGTTVPTEALA